MALEERSALDSPVLMGFALAASAGLNAYLPLLIVGIADRASTSFALTSPYSFISSTAGLLVLLGLLTVEIVLDKIPRVDHLNDLVQFAVRPAAGAILFMAVVNTDGNLHPLVAMVLGLVTAGAVHWYKAAARPLITVNTGGVGNPLVSLIEDALGLVVSTIAVILPLAGVVAAAFAGGVLRASYRRAQRPRAYGSTPRPTHDPAGPAVDTPD